MTTSSVFLLGSNLSNARVEAGDVQIQPVVVYPEAFAVSLPASETPVEVIKNGDRKPITPPGAPGASLAGEEYESPLFPLPKGENSLSSQAVPDRLDFLFSADSVQNVEAPQLPNIPSPLLSFAGNSFQDNLNAGFGQLAPPDTNGDVGPNHYVQMTNLLVRVWDKAGNPLTAPFKLSSLFTPLGGQCAAPDAGDPIVLYDPLADRWLLSQFAFASSSSPPYHECIAVSMTGDPTGAYYLYDFVTPGNEFHDYPKLGVWPGAYYMTVNQFTNGGPFNGTGAYAFDRK